MSASADPMILVINPGSTSCEFALFAGECLLAEEQHAVEPTADAVVAAARQFLAQRSAVLSGLAAIVARGGILRPLLGGVYSIDEEMVADCIEHRYGRHASNCGAPAARLLADEAGIPAYVANPPTVDELSPLARTTGLPQLPRRSIFHALNQKAVAADLAGRLGKTYATARLIVAHLGGGLSIGAHLEGRVVDVNDALEGDGPFAMNRSGSLPAMPLIMWARGKPLDEIASAVCKAGGFMAHLGTDDAREIERRIRSGDPQAKRVFEAFAYHVAKAIAALTIPLDGHVDAIAVTGGLARWERLVHRLRDRLAWLCEIHPYPGSREMEALATAALAVLRGREKALPY